MTDEERARELSVSWNYKPEAICDALLTEVPQDEIDFFVKLLQEIRAERDAELQRAMAVCEAAITAFESNGFCELCRTNSEHRHQGDCPLVANGFCNPDGSRK